jgi:glycerophosphoryl diester phosphodiesterase
MSSCALVVAHRGGAGLRPENTIAAFAHAIDLGAEGFELDVHLTRDAEVVVHHDYRLSPALARSAHGDWLRRSGAPIRELPLEALMGFDVGRPDPRSRYARSHPDLVPIDGERIPTLRAVIELVRARAPGLELWIELKTERGHPDATPPEALAEATVALLEEMGIAERCLLLGFEWSALAHARRIAPEIRRVHTVRAGGHLLGVEALLDEIASAEGSFWFPAVRDVTAARVEAARTRGLGVATWTANQPAEMKRLLALGVDSICTDYPDRLRSLLAD